MKGACIFTESETESIEQDPVGPSTTYTPVELITSCTPLPVYDWIKA